MIIYKTTNLINGKIYVGQDSKNNPNYLGSGKYINKSINKYSKENFKKEILCECNSKEELNEKEIYWIKELNSKVPNGYNLTDGGEGVFNPCDETRNKMSKLASKKIGDKNPFFNKHHSKESIEKMSKIKLGKPSPMKGKIGIYSEETLIKMRKPKSEEFKKNIKIAMNKSEVKERQKIAIIKAVNKPEIKEKHKRAVNSEKFLEKQRKPKSKEHCIKISEGMTGRKRGPYKKRKEQ